MAGLAGLTVAPLANCAPQMRLRPPATPSPVSNPDAFGLNGVIDINHGNPVTDFAAAHAYSSIRAVIHKASEGVGWTDPAYGRRRDQAQAAGLLWGAYHFGTRQYPGADQAAAFLAAAQPDDATLVALDLELNERNPANTMTLPQAEDFARAILAATGRLPLLYTHPVWADGDVLRGTSHSLGACIEPGSILAACDLWLADYRSQPELPRAWAGRGWHFWQYAGDGERGGPFAAFAHSVQGLGNCDRNLFVGDEDMLRRYWTNEAGRPGESRV